MPISAPKIPDGLPELMRGLAKSVIKENPENLYVHAAEYFENLIRERDGELERGYQTFNAYQMYADYKEKGRETLGLPKVDGGSPGSDGDDGDESGSGGSGSKSRGRRRARRARKQSSKEKDNPPTMVEKPRPGNGGEPAKQNSLSDETSTPVPVVEQEVVKLHYNPPEGPPVARVVSAQSVEAEQAVSSVLDDEQMLDSDGTGGKETGDELVDIGDDVGTAPSTAEIDESRRTAAPIEAEANGSTALQDMETCFMHANMDDLLEKHSQDPMVDDNDGETATAEEKTIRPTEGEDIPEGPQPEKSSPSKTVPESEPAKQDVPEREQKDDAKKVDDETGPKVVSGKELSLEEEVNTAPTAPDEVDEVSEAGKGAANSPVGSVERSKSPENEANVLSKNVDDGSAKEVTGIQGRPQSAEKIDQEDTVRSPETVPEPEINSNLPSKGVSLEKSDIEETATPVNDESHKVVDEKSTTDTNVQLLEEAVAAPKMYSDLEQIKEPVTITSRMGFDEDETIDDADKKVETPSSVGQTISDEGNAVKEEKNAPASDENAVKPDNETVPSSEIQAAPSIEEVKDETDDTPLSNKDTVVESGSESVTSDTVVPPGGAEGQTADATETVDKGLVKSNGQEPQEQDVTTEEPVATDDKRGVASEQGKAKERDVVPSPEVSTAALDPVDDVAVETLPDASQSTAALKDSDVASDAPVGGVIQGTSDEKKLSKDPVSSVSSFVKQESKVENESPVLPTSVDGSEHSNDQKTDDKVAQDTDVVKDIQESKLVIVEELKSKSEEKEDEQQSRSVEEEKVVKVDAPAEQPVKDNIAEPTPVQDSENPLQSFDKVASAGDLVKVDSKESVPDTEPMTDSQTVADSTKELLPAVQSFEKVESAADLVKVDSKESVPETKPMAESQMVEDSTKELVPAVPILDKVESAADLVKVDSKESVPETEPTADSPTVADSTQELLPAVLDKVASAADLVKVDSKESVPETEPMPDSQTVTASTKELVPAEIDKAENALEEKGKEARRNVDDKLTDVIAAGSEGVKQEIPQELKSVVMDTIPQLPADVSVEDDNTSKETTENGDTKSVTSSKDSTDEDKDAKAPANDPTESPAKEPERDEETAAVEAAPEKQKDDAVLQISSELPEEPSSEEPPGVKDEPVASKSEEASHGSADPTGQESAGQREPSLEEVVEEPCIKRVVTPTKSIRPNADDNDGKQVEELEEIKKVDLSQLSKDSAEALFYSLKKSELENQEPDGETGEIVAPVAGSGSQAGSADDDDKDVVVTEEPPVSPTDGSKKRTFTDDFLDENPITEVQAASDVPASDGVQPESTLESTKTARSSSEVAEQEDEFNPMVMVSMRSKQFQEQLHSRAGGVAEQNDGQPEDEPTGAKRPVMRRCMTEMTGLQMYASTTAEDEPVDPSRDDPAYVEEEDQFDGYYIGHIKNKILASSVSVADSDYFDPTRSTEEPVDENNVRTALETIASTDTESTIASQATIQQAGKRSYLRKHSQNTSSNIPYASFGNAAIDRSLDEFIEREERHKQDEAMAEAATKIQRSYRTHKKRLLRDYHSTMRTFTEDHSAESGEEYAANVIQIKLDQKRAGSPTLERDGGEESDSTAGSLHPQALGAIGGKRPMYSLNIDEYDTVARRMTLTRGVALQRNSTPDDDSGRSASASTDRKPSLSSAPTPESAPVSSGSGEALPLAAADPHSSEDKSEKEKPVEPSDPAVSVDDPETKDDAHSTARSRPNRTAPAATGRELDQAPLPKVAGRTNLQTLDVQSLLLIARQRTMPVQIDSSVIRVLPKHMRKRISSAGMLNGAGKRK